MKIWVQCASTGSPATPAATKAAAGASNKTSIRGRLTNQQGPAREEYQADHQILIRVPSSNYVKVKR